MEIVIEIIIPVFGVVILGYFATKVGWFDSKSEQGLASFVFNFVIPITLFRSLALADLPNQIPWDYFATYYFSAIICYISGMILSGFMFKRNFGGQVITGFGNAFGNTVLLGLPLILATFGEEATFPFFLILSVHGVLFFTITTVLLEYDLNRDEGLNKLPRKIIMSIIKNPILVAIFVGLSLNLSNLMIPTPVDDIAALMQKAIAPCALFALGASITKYGFAGRLSQSLVMVMFKLIIMPFLVFYFGTQIFDIPRLWLMVAVLMAAQPSGVMTYMFASRYKIGEAIATTSIFISTGMSLFSLSIILYLFDVR